MKKIPMLEKFAAQSLVELDGELVFSKEKFAELIVKECTSICAKQAWESRTNDDWTEYNALSRVAGQIKKHFGVEE